MATMRDICMTALRKIRVIASGETPAADEMNDAVQALQSLYTAWVSAGMFGRLTNVIAEGDYTAGENQRVQISDGATVTLPLRFDYDWGGVRAPRNRSVVVVVDADAGTEAIHLYDAGRGGWVALGDLAEGDEAPLSNRDPDGLACCLAEALAEEYGADIGPITQRRAGSFRMALSGSWDDEARPTEICYF